MCSLRRCTRKRKTAKPRQDRDLQLVGIAGHGLASGLGFASVGPAFRRCRRLAGIRCFPVSGCSRAGTLVGLKGAGPTAWPWRNIGRNQTQT